MSTKVIKLQDNENNVLLPVTDAKLVQMKVENETKSVQDVIIENELITARALTDLNDTKQDVIDDLDEIRSGAALGETALQTETQLSKGTTGSGNAVTDISVNNHQITLTKGATFLTEHQDLSSYADGAEYDSTNHLIYLKHGNTRLSNPINASDFIKDGMVDTVEVTEGNLVITFNTDSGKEDIEIPLSDIFDPSLYYTKEEIDEHELVTARSLTELHDTKSEKPLIITFTPQGNASNGETLLTPSVTLSEAAEAYKNGRQLIGQIEIQQGLFSEFIINPTLSGEVDNNSYYGFAAENIFLGFIGEDFNWSNLTNNTEVCKLTNHLDDVFKTHDATASNLTNTQAVRFGYDDSLTEDTNTYYPNGSSAGDTIAFYSFNGDDRHTYINLTLPSSAIGLQISTLDLWNFSGGVYDTKIKFTVPNDNFFVNINEELKGSSYDPVVLGGDIKNFSAGTVVELDYMVPLNSTGGEWIVHTNKAETEASPSMTEVTYSELKTFRDNGELTPGSYYRITDYQCTTTQENTQSAGHQFDIVLLALSENKLAEEGWAMMHDNIYDVTFGDGVTKKCWVYSADNELFNFVDIDTLLGVPNADISEITIDDDNKTVDASGSYQSTDLIDENLPYNYFQNSNLSAWKVWYCLDNDTDRFVWAQGDEVIPDTLVVTQDGNEVSYVRRGGTRKVNDTTYYKWKLPEGLLVTEYLTEKEFPTEGDVFYRYQQAAISLPLTAIGTVSSFTPEHIEEGNGRGVIYRLIDEFNNDIKYDFKNIQFRRKITNGQYDANGTETWCYTLNIWYNDMCQDASIVGNTLMNDEGYITGVYNNNFGYVTAYDLYLEGVNTLAFALGNNVALSSDEDGIYMGIFSNTIGDEFYYNTIGDNFYSNTIGDNFHENTIGISFFSNIIGNGFYSNTIGNYFGGNTIGDNFYSNTVGDEFDSNTIGNNFYSNTIGDNFYSNTIGNSFQYNTIGSRKGNIITTINYVRYIRVEDGVHYINITTNATTSVSNWLQNITIAQGVSGTSSTRKVIIHGTLNDTFRTTYQSANSQTVSV